MAHYKYDLTLINDQKLPFPWQRLYSDYDVIWVSIAVHVNVNIVDMYALYRH